MNQKARLAIAAGLVAALGAGAAKAEAGYALDVADGKGKAARVYIKSTIYDGKGLTMTECEANLETMTRVFAEQFKSEQEPRVIVGSECVELDPSETSVK